MPPHNNNVPIVGLPFKVFECIPTAIIQCNCKLDNPPITIPGVDIFKRCEFCMKIYGITAVSYNRRNAGPVTVTVSIININAPVEEVKENEPANLA